MTDDESKILIAAFEWSDARRAALMGEMTSVRLDRLARAEAALQSAVKRYEMAMTAANP